MGSLNNIFCLHRPPSPPAVCCADCVRQRRNTKCAVLGWLQESGWEPLPYTYLAGVVSSRRWPNVVCLGWAQSPCTHLQAWWFWLLVFFSIYLGLLRPSVHLSWKRWMVLYGWDATCFKWRSSCLLGFLSLVKVGQHDVDRQISAAVILWDRCGEETYQLIFLLTLTEGQRLWVLTKRTGLREQGTEIMSARWIG